MFAPPAPRQFKQLPPHRPRIVVEPPEAPSPAAAALRAAALRAAAADPAPALLRDYAARREASLVGRVLRAAHRLSLSNDLVIVVAPDANTDPGSMLFAASTHPWHSLLDRAERGGRPRLVWLDPTVDDDQLAGILDVARGLELRGARDDGWALVVPEAATLLGRARLARIARRFEQELEASRGRRSAWGTDRWVRVGADEVSLNDDAARAADASRAAAGPGPAAPDASVWTAAALLPAAIAGADILSLLKGAAAMAKLAEAPDTAGNPLDALLAWWAVEHQRAGRLPALTAAHHALRAVARWWNARRLGQKSAATDGACVELGLDAGRREPLAATLPADTPNALLASSDDAASSTAGRLRLARLDDAAIGQLAALLDLAARAFSPAPDAAAPRGPKPFDVSLSATGDLPCPSQSLGLAIIAGRSTRASTGC